MQNSDVLGRIDRIKDDVAQNRMGDAVAHLMDFGREFNDSRIADTAVIIKKDYTSMWEGQQLGPHDRIAEQDRLVARMLGLLEYLGQYSNRAETEPAKMGEPDRDRPFDPLWQILGTKERKEDAGGFVDDWKDFVEAETSSTLPNGWFS